MQSVALGATGPEVWRGFSKLLLDEPVTSSGQVDQKWDHCPTGPFHSTTGACNVLDPTPSEGLIQFMGFSPQKKMHICKYNKFQSIQSSLLSQGTIHKTFLIIFRYLKKCYEENRQVYKLETPNN